MKNLDPRIAGKIFHVESEDVRNTMHPHGGHNPCIVCLLSRDLMLHDETFPPNKSFGGVGEDNKEALHPGKLRCRPLHTHPQTVRIHRARCYHPELNEVLRGDEKATFLSSQGNDRSANKPGLWMMTVQTSEQNIGVKKRIYRHSSSRV